MGLQLILTSAKKRLTRLVASAKGHARKAGRLFELTIEFVETLYAQQRGRCGVTGLQFNQQRFPEALVKHPFAPSIDREIVEWRIYDR